MIMGNPRAREFQKQQADQAAWDRIRTEPRLAIQNVHARGIGRRRLQLLVLPSFQEGMAWEVREAEDWRLARSQVVETLPEVMLLGYEQIPFVSAELARYFERTASLTLPLRPDQGEGGGCDGTLYELALFGAGFSSWRFQWWSVSPEPWRPLVELAAEMEAAFRATGRSLKDQNSPNA